MWSQQAAVINLPIIKLVLNVLLRCGFNYWGVRWLKFEMVLYFLGFNFSLYNFQSLNF